MKARSVSQEVLRRSTGFHFFDVVLQVNDINFENMSNDDAVRVLRDIVHKPG